LGKVTVNCDVHVPDKLVHKHLKYMKKNNLQSTSFYFQNHPVYIYVETW